MNQQMGLSVNPLDWFTSQESLDIEHGDKILEAYFNAAVAFPAFMHSTYEEFRQSIGGDRYVESLGANVRTFMHPGLFDVIYFPYDDAAKRVALLAEETGGQASAAQINNAAIDKTVDAIQSITEGVTTGLTSSAKLLKYLPYIAIAGLGIYAYVMAKSTGSSVGRFVDASADRIRRNKMQNMANPKRRK